MNILNNLVLFLGLLCLALAQPTVRIRQGELSGRYMSTVNGRSISAFLGIPYAKPPIGNLRFKEPVPADPWEGVYNATSDPDFCLQYSHVTYNTATPVIGSEDCLFLNVYVPTELLVEERQEDLDVMIFIHGGAFMFGCSSIPGPEFLLDKDVILVTLNYRLGALGFLSLEDSILPGNNGMKDQVLALKWIKKNIAAFGGNPNNIVLTGLSAGGASVHFHMLSPLSQGIFTKAISMGGSALCPWAQMEAAREKTLMIANYLGCPTNDSLLIMKCLRTRPASKIVAATALFQRWMYNPFSPFGIVIEPPSPNAFLSESPVNIILKGKAQDIPYLVTMNSDEGLYPGAEILADSKLADELDNNWNEYLPFLLDYNYTCTADKIDNVSNRIKEFYLGNSRIMESKKQFIKMLGDRLFYDAIVKSTKLHAEYYSSPVYAYLFSHKGSVRLSNIFNMAEDIYDGTSHADDVGYVVRVRHMPLERNSTDMSLSNRMIDLWFRFISGDQMPREWPTVQENLPNFGFLEIKNPYERNDEVRIEADYGNEKFWDSLNLNENIACKGFSKDEL
ncbi:hypothetical protein O3M35_000440 [Rhynocoris fuscipes]|uniref:Carboxylic ester hydrolase n=1 Tax=Rhynocoris fuscipes TaxID=488301 RepID=A0AAW1DMM3_9HEMI